MQPQKGSAVGPPSGNSQQYPPPPRVPQQSFASYGAQSRPNTNVQSGAYNPQSRVTYVQSFGSSAVQQPPTKGPSQPPMQSPMVPMPGNIHSGYQPPQYATQPPSLGVPPQNPLGGSNLGSHISQKQVNLSRLNSSKLNRTIVNELIDPDSEDDVMDRIETQNNIVENLKEIPNYEREYAVPTEQLQEIKQKKDYDIFHCIVPNFRLEDIFDMQHYQLIRGGGSASVYSLDTNHRSLKLVMDVPHSRDKVLAALIDPGNYHLWNDQIDLGNIKLRIYSQNTIIAYQKHKAFDNHFKERDFVYIRHLFRKEEVVYMVDQSIEHSNFPPFDYITRGEIKLALWAFESPSSSSTRVTYMIHMNFKGKLGGAKSAESIIRYLMSMSGLSSYLVRGKIQTKVRDYFDLNWRISDVPSSPAFGNQEEFEDAMSFDRNQELYTTALPEIDWLDRTIVDDGVPRKPSKDQSRIVTQSIDPKSQEFLHNEIVNSYNKSKQLYDPNGYYAAQSQVNASRMLEQQQKQLREQQLQQQYGFKYINGKPVEIRNPTASQSSNKITQKTGSMQVKNRQTGNDIMSAPLAPLPTIPENNLAESSTGTRNPSMKAIGQQLPPMPPRMMGPPNVELINVNSSIVKGQILQPQLSGSQQSASFYQQPQPPPPNIRGAVPPNGAIQTMGPISPATITVFPPTTSVVRSTVRPDVPSPGDLVHKKSSRVHLKPPPSQNDDPHSSQEEGEEISRPEQVHVFKEVPLKFDPVTGYVVLPKQYLTKRHRMEPVKSEYKLIKQAGWKDYMLRDVWEITPTGELKCINQAILAEQHKVLSYVVGKLAKNLLSGKSILNMSLPVSIFGEQSNLELGARGFGFAPLFLERAANQPNPIERFKLVVAFSLAYGCLFIEMSKPFNPILGETYQGWFNGCPVYCQQLSHHPPVSAFYMIGRGYKASATIEFKVDIGVNTAVGKNDGEYKIIFDRYPKNIIRFRTMDGQVRGVTFGERQLLFSGKSYFYEEADGYYLELAFNPYKKGFFSIGKQSHPSDWVEGEIVKTSPAFISKFRKMTKREGPSKKEITQTIGTVSGRWTVCIKIDGVEYFNFIRDQPCQMEQQPYPLSSNCGYRQDVAYLRKKDIARAQVQKQRLEVLQRDDKKLREKKRGKGH